jgi:hypothetical protein
VLPHRVGPLLLLQRSATTACTANDWSTCLKAGGRMSALLVRPLVAGGMLTRVHDRR